MARIPLQTRQVMQSTAVGLPRMTPQQMGAGIGAAFAQAGDDMARLAQQRRQTDERSEASVRLARLMERTGQIVTQRRSSAAAGGAGHSAGVLADFEREAATLGEGLTDPDVQAWMRVQLAEERSRLTVNEGAWEAGKRADKLVLDFQVADDAERTALLARPDRAGLMAAIARREAVARALDLPDEAREKLALEARHGLTLSYMQGLIETNPYAAQAEINSGNLAGLIDADRLASLKNRADVEVRGIEAAKEQARREAAAEARRQAAEARRAAADARREVGDRIRDVQDYLRDGGTISAEELRSLTSAAASIGRPELARSVQRLGIASIVNTELRGASPAQLQAEVNNLSARINAAGGKPDGALLVARDAAEAKLRAVTTAVNQDPLSLAVREGVIDSLPPLGSDPASFKARVDAARRVQARYGGPLRLLTDEEAGDLAQRMNGDAKSRAEAAQLLTAFGPKGVAAAAAQIAPKDAKAAHVAVLAARGGGVGRKFLATVTEGEQRLAGNPKIINRQIADDTLAEATGGALRLRPQVAQVVRQVADQYYAGRAGREGFAEFDPDAYRQAISNALGRWQGLDGKFRGGLGTDLAGNTTLLPTDVAQDEFEASLNAISDDSLGRFGAAAPVDMRGKPVPADIIRKGEFVAVGDGRYRVLVGGRQVMARNGAPFEINIRWKR